MVVEPDLTPEGARSLHSGFFAGSRLRRATVGAITWAVDGRYLIAGHLVSSTIVVYRTDTVDGRFSLQRVARTQPHPAVDQPEDLAVTPDGRHLVVTNSGTGSLSLLDLEALLVAGEVGVVGRAHAAGDRVLHGVDVSPDGRWAVYSTIDTPGGLRVVAIDDMVAAGADEPVPAHTVDDPVQREKPKAVTFTPDGAHLVLAYGPNVGSTRVAHPRGWVEVREWDAGTGRPGTVVARRWPPGPGCGEAVAFLRDRETFVVTDQVGDAAHFLRWDPRAESLTVLDRPSIGWVRGGLRAPHGCLVTPDGSALVIASYGDASLRVFDLDQRLDPVVGRSGETASAPLASDRRASTSTS